MLLNRWFCWISENCRFRIDYNIDRLIGILPANISRSKFDKISWSMIEFGFNFSLNEGLSIFSLVDPFSLRITNSKTYIDDISIILLFSRCNIYKFNGTSEISFFVESIGEVSIQNEFIKILFLTKKNFSQRIRGSVKVFYIFRKIHTKSSRSLVWDGLFLNLDWAFQKLLG